LRCDDANTNANTPYGGRNAIHRDSIRATTLARMSLDQLTAAADAVARVRCDSAGSQWENGAIWTVTTFDVVESMKGAPPPQVTVRLPGGRVGHLTAAVDGTPKFNAGDEAVVFLERSRAGGFSVAGWVEGTFRITRDPRNGHETVTQEFEHLRGVRPGDPCVPHRRRSPDAARTVPRARLGRDCAHPGETR